MIEKRTVFVLGAGASRPYLFPSGNELTNQVHDHLSQPSAIEELRSCCGFTEGEISSFRQALRYSGQTSVDAFLEHRPDLLEIGKAAIAYLLIKCENKPVLLNEMSGAWLRYIYGRMSSSFNDFCKNQVSFITFNYDRVLEEFLSTSLSNSYGKPLDECRTQLEQIPIIHLHGHLGALPWQSKNSRPFEPIINKQTMDVARHGIKIIHETPTVERDKDFQKGLNLLQNSEQTVFLGFGYNTLNMQRLGIEHTRAGAIGTGYGLTSRERAERETASQNKVRIVDSDCITLLRNLEW